MNRSDRTPPAQIVEALYEGFRRRDLPAIFGVLSPDVEIVQGARRFFGQLGSHINSTMPIDRLIDYGDHVAAVGWNEGTVNSTGAAYRVPIVHFWPIRTAGSRAHAEEMKHNYEYGD